MLRREELCIFIDLLSRIGRALSCRKAIPAQGFSSVWCHPIASFIHQSQVILGIGLPLLSSLAEPFHCFLVIAFGSLSQSIEFSKIELSVGAALIRCLSPPPHRFFVGVWDTFPS